MKLPDDKIQNLILSHIKILSQDAGFNFKSESVRVGILTGLQVKFKNAEIQALDDDKQNLKIEALTVRPKLFSLPFTMKKFSLSSELLEGSLSGTIGLSSTSLLLDLDSENINLEKATLLKKFIFISLGGVLSSAIDLNFDSNDPVESNGSLKIKLMNLKLPSQSVAGFNIPEVQISESQILGNLEKGKLTFKDTWIGKDLKVDDLTISVNGDSTISSPIERSMLNIKAIIAISKKLNDKIPLLESLLSSARCTDGRYAFRISGTLMSLDAKPDGC